MNIKMTGTKQATKLFTAKLTYINSTHIFTMTLGIHNLPTKRLYTFTINEEYCKFLHEYTNTHTNANADDCISYGTNYQCHRKHINIPRQIYK